MTQHTRIHIGFLVRDLDTSVAYYRTLLGAEPTKQRPGYAKFAPESPRVNLSLSQAIRAQPATSQHFGVEVENTESVISAAERLKNAGYAVELEESRTCCYAVQNKVWSRDPDGNAWEVFFVVADSEKRDEEGGSCCTDGRSCAG